MFGCSAEPQRRRHPVARRRQAIAGLERGACACTGERETLGLYLTGHPIARFEADLPRFVSRAHRRSVSEQPVSAGDGERGFSRGRAR